MKRPRIVSIFVIEYQHNGERVPWDESLSSAVAMALGRELAKQGLRPVMRRLELTQAEIHARSRRLRL
jgi:hypothetical protein